jgi:hypothetical protein
MTTHSAGEPFFTLIQTNPNDFTPVIIFLSAFTTVYLYTQGRLTICSIGMVRVAWMIENIFQALKWLDKGITASPPPEGLHSFVAEYLSPFFAQAQSSD